MIVCKCWCYSHFVHCNIHTWWWLCNILGNKLQNFVAFMYNRHTSLRTGLIKVPEQSILCSFMYNAIVTSRSTAKIIGPRALPPPHLQPRTYDFCMPQTLVDKVQAPCKVKSWIRHWMHTWFIDSFGCRTRSATRDSCHRSCATVVYHASSHRNSAGILSTSFPWVNVSVSEGICQL